MAGGWLRAVATFLVVACCAHALIDDALDVIRFGKEVGEEIINSWDLLGRPFNVSGGVELPLIRRREREVLARLANVARAIDRLELAVERGEALSALLARGTARGTRLELRLHELVDLLARVATSERQMREYSLLQNEFERSTLEDFASWCVSHDPGALIGLLERIHSLLVPPHGHLIGRSSVFYMMLDDMQEDNPDRCELQMSTHQIIYDMYNTVALTEIKGYAMMQFSWMLLRIYGKGNFTQEATLTRKRYEERAMKTALAARTAMQSARRDVYRCDPPHPEEGTTYAQVTKLLQGYVENEVDMNDEGSCRENCAFYTLAQRRGCFKEQFCSRQPPCKGRIINCQYIDSDMWICPATWTSTRRYEYIEYENGRTLGHPGSCRKGVTKVDSWWRYLLVHCSYCFCFCEDAVETSERFFSMREIISDVATNKVVTGIRLVKLGRVFHLQISEGTLGARGNVTPGDWIKVQQFDPNDLDTREEVDYHTLTYERRAIDLDELESPEGHVLTGVRFRMIGAHLHFEIHSTPFNYTTGRLAANRGQWISNDNTEGGVEPRSPLKLIRPDIPTRSKTPLKVDSKHDQYIEFTHSDMEADAAQSTVPFVDIQPVQPLRGATLVSGAGLIHRGAQGSGGYIGVKLITYDYTRHVRAEPPPPQPDVEDNAADFMTVVN